MTLESDRRDAEWREQWRQYEEKLAEKWLAVIRSGVPIEDYVFQELEEARARAAQQ